MSTLQDAILLADEYLSFSVDENQMNFCSIKSKVEKFMVTSTNLGHISTSITFTENEGNLDVLMYWNITGRMIHKILNFFYCIC